MKGRTTTHVPSPPDEGPDRSVTPFVTPPPRVLGVGRSPVLVVSEASNRLTTTDSETGDGEEVHT